MDCHNIWFFSIHFLIHFNHLISQRRILPVFPCRISSLNRVVSSEEFCQIADLIGKSCSCCLNRASDTGASQEFVLPKLHNSDIGRGFHQTVNASAHLLDTKRNFHQEKQNFLSACRMKNSCRGSSQICNLNCYSFVCSCILFTESFLNFFRTGFYCIYILNKKLCICLSCNSIVLLSACKRNNLISSFFLKCVEKSSHQNIGIGTFFVNFSSGMSAHKTCDLYCRLLAFCLHSLYRNGADSGKTACTADPQASLCLRIQVDQSFSF